MSLVEPDTCDTQSRIRRRLAFRRIIEPSCGEMVRPRLSVEDFGFPLTNVVSASDFFDVFIENESSDRNDEFNDAASISGEFGALNEIRRAIGDRNVVFFLRITVGGVEIVSFVDRFVERLELLEFCGDR